ncbi:SDR family oxidoreductase [Sphingomonas sp. BIUV-7]|uniref:SDR family oxidoreductase n=1 Tax=Sphingomonas natans TaxID=3063330 RepID=A0ABT8Y8D1_9SPHN|nr:SDR family NAD(P)-dependent oxidoreductase [Sphingomonas sp. BIUV-7]MDO6414574.1 SDR family oxidoreductase [Sphingomonas sp. BIUV-7]
MALKVIVTGGLGAWGRAVCQTLGAKGFDVAVVDLAPAPEGGDAPIFGGVDLAEETAVADAFRQAVARLGGLDGVVNIAGGFVWETVAEGSIETWDRMFRMNLRTAAVSSRAALAYLSTGGAIVNVGAAAAANVATGMAPYAASKAGVMALTEGLADEVRAKGIRVNAVLPTIIDTPTNRQDMPDADTSGWVKPASAANVIAFLLSDESASITGAGLRLSLGG